MDMAIQIFYFFLRQFSSLCVFQSLCLFHLCCRFYQYKVFICIYFTSNIFKIYTNAPCLICDTGNLYILFFSLNSLKYLLVFSMNQLLFESPLFVYLLLISKLMFILSSTYFVFNLLFSIFFKKYLFIWVSWVFVAACGIQFPDQGSNPGLLHWECRVLAMGPPGKSLFSIF